MLLAILLPTGLPLGKNQSLVPLSILLSVLLQHRVMLVKQYSASLFSPISVIVITLLLENGCPLSNSKPMLENIYLLLHNNLFV